MAVDIRHYNGFDDVVHVDGKVLHGQPIESNLKVTNDHFEFDLFLDERLSYFQETALMLKDIRHKVKSLNIIHYPPDNVRTVRIAIRRY